jgi:hypothetical protein
MVGVCLSYLIWWEDEELFLRSQMDDSWQEGVGIFTPQNQEKIGYVGEELSLEGYSSSFSGNSSPAVPPSGRCFIFLRTPDMSSTSSQTALVM